jgi:hypothetical protein
MRLLHELCPMALTARMVSGVRAGIRRGIASPLGETLMSDREMAFPTFTVNYARYLILEAITDKTPVGINVEVKRLPQTNYGVESLLVEFIAFRGEPIKPSLWYRLKRWIKTLG